MHKTKRYKKLALLLGILAGLLCLAFFQTLTDPVTAEQQPAAKINPMEKDRINGHGLEGEQTLSSVRTAKLADAVCFEDRVVQNFVYDSQKLVRFGAAVRGLRTLCPEIEEVYVVPVPDRVLMEQGFEADAARYKQFIKKLTIAVGKGLVVVDPWPELSKHTEEYIFYRTERGWTARGAYYGAAALCREMGIAPLPFAAYEEHQYQLFTGTLYTDVKRDLSEQGVAQDGHRMAEDACFYYLLPGSRNVESRINLDGLASVEPILSHSRTGRSAFLGGRFLWAVLQGDRQSQELEEETLLLLCDDGGKLLAPYIANHCDRLYVANLAWDASFPERLPQIVEEYNIRKVVIAQTARDMGEASVSVALHSLIQ